MMISITWFHRERERKRPQNAWRLQLAHEESNLIVSSSRLRFWGNCATMVIYEMLLNFEEIFILESIREGKR